MELAYRCWGTKNREIRAKLVFLHGMGGTGSLWRPIAASLEERYAILAPDQRGHGESRIVSIPGGREEPRFDPLAYGQDVVDTLFQENFHPVWLVGHSMGVRTACAAAHLRPDWTQGLVLIDLGFSGPAGGGLGENLAQFLRILPHDFASRAEARGYMDSHCPDPSIGQYLMAVSTVGTDGRVRFPFDHSALIQTIQAAKDASVRDWVRELLIRKIPILVLRGANSLVWSHEDFEEEKAAFGAYPSIEFMEIAGAGHGLPFEQRLAFVALLENFIARSAPH